MYACKMYTIYMLEFHVTEVPAPLDVNFLLILITYTLHFLAVRILLAKRILRRQSLAFTLIHGNVAL